MDQILKERLVGMAVLLVLGVIFIPLILDGDKAQIQNTKNLQLPTPSGTATHELNFKDGNVTRLELPVPGKNNSNVKTAKPESSAVVAPPEASKEILIPPVETKNTQSANGGSISRTEITPDSKAEAKQKTGSATLTSATTLEKNPTAVLTEIDRVASDPSAAWVVQIGSFGDRNNAEKEVALLKAKGFPAFLSRYVSADEKVLYRVRVGPEKERLRAEKLAERLLKAGVKGQVVAHP